MSKKTVTVDQEVLDINFLNTITNGDIEFEKELFTIFKDSCKSNIDKMKDSLETKDDDVWKMSSHSLKGASASIGAFELSKSLEAAQTHAEENYEGKATILQEVEDKFNAVIAVLNNRLDN